MINDDLKDGKIFLANNLRKSRPKKPTTFSLINELDGNDNPTFFFFKNATFGEMVGCKGFSTNEIKALRVMSLWLSKAADYLEVTK